MANSYFNFTNPVVPGSPIMSAKYNGDFRAVERAFDTLPSPNDLITSYKNFGVTTGSATAYRLSLPAFDTEFGYATGMQAVVKVHVNNSGPATISINGLPVKPIVNLITGLGPLQANDLRKDAIYSLRYDGVNFQVVNAVSNAVALTKMNADTAKAAADDVKQAATLAETRYANLLSGPLCVGAVKFYTPDVDPNTLYPGTTWTQLPGTSSVAYGWRRTA